jgi:hypothetical protein
MCSADAMYRRGGTREEIEKGLAELVKFAQDTYHSLLRIEGYNPSSLEQMCRLDISVMINPETARFEYFVNEVERGPLICLFAYLHYGFYTAERAGDETREYMLKFLDSKQRQV